AAKAAGEAAVKELKAKSPGDKYPKGWSSKAENSRTGANVIVYNKDRYMLAHLLEYGHPKVNGGRVPGQVHIQPVETMAGNKFEEELKRRIESGT
ncbi:MAG: HK97 gp10 family phage protein, partial [Clostridia bacterium]|nr:HK97 gp10 family phage protein [Clostridia bacterium]